MSQRRLSALLYLTVTAACEHKPPALGNDASSGVGPTGSHDSDRTTDTTADPTTTCDPHASSTTQGEPPDGLPTYPPPPCVDDSDCPQGYECLRTGVEPKTYHCVLPYDPDRHGCDLWAQDCADGYKCVPAYSHDTHACVPSIGDAIHGEACTIELPVYGSRVPCEEWGESIAPDTCGPGSQCLGDGVCHDRCTLVGNTPTCPHPMHYCGSGRVSYWCIEYCDPLVQSCPDGEVCVAGLVSPFCAPDASGDEGQLYDPCTEANTCDPGLACVDSMYVKQCDPGVSDGCCTAFCDITEANPCPDPGQACAAFYGEYDYDIFKHIGACIDAS